MNERIGVIVPVYKTEKYVAECIESILAQTYTNFRLILVDDGSPDNAGRICDEYAKKDSRITVIHQENAGVTRARAAGVEAAEDCTWITFVDSDDMLSTTALHKYQSLISKEVDIILNSNYYTERATCASISPFYTLNEDYINIEDFRKKMIATKGGMPWGRMFRRTIITKFAFDIPRDVYFGEDAITNIRIAFNTEKNIAVVSEPLYFYRQENNGVCKNFTLEHEYEELFRKHILISIPEGELKNYCNEYVWRRIWLWGCLFNNSIRKPSWSNTPLHTNLIAEIKKYDYNISWFDWWLIKHTNPIIRFFIILTRKVYSLFKRLI